MDLCIKRITEEKLAQSQFPAYIKGECYYGIKSH